MSTRSGAPIWAIEDDPGVQFIYEEILGLRYNLRQFSSMDELRSALDSETEGLPVLLIVDLKLSGESFLDLLGSPQNDFLLKIPFLVISSVDDTDIMRECFNEGALDFLSKPFGKAELIVKVERALAQAKEQSLRAASTPWVDIEEMFIANPSKLTVLRGPLESVPLTSKEFQIFSILEQAPGHITRRGEIRAQVWGGVRVGQKTFNVHLFNLRRKLAPLGLEISYRAPDAYELTVRARPRA